MAAAARRPSYIQVCGLGAKWRAPPQNSGGISHHMHLALVWQGIVRETSGVLVLPDSKPVSHKTSLHILEAFCPYKKQIILAFTFIPSSLL